MRRVCPACGAVVSAEAWENDAQQRQFDAIVTRLPSGVSRNITAYIALFRPAVPENLRGYRGISWGRALRLAGEINLMIKDSHISWKHKPARPIDATHWGLAMEKVVSNPPRDLPLTHHNYLRSIAYSVADDADRAREVIHNQSERDGTLRRKSFEKNSSGDASLEPLAPEVLTAIREKNYKKRTTR